MHISLYMFFNKSTGEGNLHPHRPPREYLREYTSQPRETKDSTCGPNPYGSQSQSQEEPLR